MPPSMTRFSATLKPERQRKTQPERYPPAFQRARKAMLEDITRGQRLKGPVSIQPGLMLLDAEGAGLMAEAWVRNEGSLTAAAGNFPYPSGTWSAGGGDVHDGSPANDHGTKPRAGGGSNAHAQNFIKVLIRTAGKNAVAGDAHVFARTPGRSAPTLFPQKTHVLFHAASPVTDGLLQRNSSSRRPFPHASHPAPPRVRLLRRKPRNGAANAASSARHTTTALRKISIHHGQIGPFRRGCQ